MSDVSVHPKPVHTVRHSTSGIGAKRKLEGSFRAPLKVPKSLGITTMMKLGQAITATDTSQETVDVSRFNIRIWSGYRPYLHNLQVKRRNLPKWCIVKLNTALKIKIASYTF